MRFFLIATAIPLIATNGLYRTQWRCSHYATATTSPTPYGAHYEQKQIAVANRTVWTGPYCKNRISPIPCGVIWAYWAEKEPVFLHSNRENKKFQFPLVNVPHKYWAVFPGVNPSLHLIPLPNWTLNAKYNKMYVMFSKREYVLG